MSDAMKLVQDIEAALDLTGGLVAVEAMLEELKSKLQASEWVSVEDRFPEEGMKVDVWADGKRFTDLIFENGDFGIVEESVDLDEITRGSDYITKTIAKYELKVSYWKPITPPTE